MESQPAFHGRTKLAFVAALAIVAIVGIASTTDHGLSLKESVQPVAPLSAPAKAIVPEEDFLEDLPPSLKREAEEAGKEAKAPKVQEQVATSIGASTSSSSKASNKSQASKKPKKMTQYEANCMTLKAFAMTVVDELDDKSRALNVLKPILQSVAAKGNCVDELDKEFANLKTDTSIMLEDSIAKAMTEAIEHNMKEGRGILVWRRLEFHNAGCDLDAVECLKLSKTKRTGGQFVFVDANRVGWSGFPGIFHKLSVRSSALLDMVHKLKMPEEKLVKNHIEGEEQKPWLTKKQGKYLKKWDGNF